MEYIKELTGTLIKVEEDENARFRFEIWFDYTRRGINLVREGAMVAVPNFASNGQEHHLSILEIVTILPMHYGLGSDSSGYPGFVIEAAKSAALDWEEQEHESTEDTTKIKCMAIPTNFEFVQSARANRDDTLQEESNLPMVGASAHLLDTKSTEFVVNYGIRSDENVTLIGTLIRDANVKIKVRIQDLFRTHFGVFGFTGAGKSNLLSTVIAQTLSETGEPLKIVFFDLMSEYSTLVIDQLCHHDDAVLIALGAETLPQSTLEYAGLPQDAPQQQRRDKGLKAVEDLTNTALLPPALISRRADFAPAYTELLVKRKIRVWQDQDTSVGGFIDEHAPNLFKGAGAKATQPFNNFISKIKAAHGNAAFSEQAINSIKDDIANLLQNPDLSTTARNNVSTFRQKLETEGQRLVNQPTIPARLRITIPEIVSRLNDRSKSGLFIVQAHDPDTLRDFAAMLGNRLYDSRRISGLIVPLVSFIFDEADEFIPQQGNDSQDRSAAVAMKLARRGRKFGLGIGIATQRVRYLNTSIMAQPHTYFVSKMPRLTDRQAVSEAFGTSEDMFRQTFKFKKGDWLLMSHDATGMEAIPIPIHLYNANERIRKFLDNANRSAKAAPAP